MEDAIEESTSGQGGGSTNDPQTGQKEGAATDSNLMQEGQRPMNGNLDGTLEARGPDSGDQKKIRNCLPRHAAASNTTPKRSLRRLFNTARISEAAHVYVIPIETLLTKTIDQILSSLRLPSWSDSASAPMAGNVGKKI